MVDGDDLVGDGCLAARSTVVVVVVGGWCGFRSVGVTVWGRCAVWVGPGQGGGLLD